MVPQDAHSACGGFPGHIVQRFGSAVDMLDWKCDPPINLADNLTCAQYERNILANEHHAALAAPG